MHLAEVKRLDEDVVNVATGNWIIEVVTGNRASGSEENDKAGNDARDVAVATFGMTVEDETDGTDGRATVAPLLPPFQ